MPSAAPKASFKIPHRKNFRRQMKKWNHAYSAAIAARSPWEDGPPPRRPRGSNRKKMAQCISNKRQRHSYNYVSFIDSTFVENVKVNCSLLELWPSMPPPPPPPPPPPGLSKYHKKDTGYGFMSLSAAENCSMSGSSSLGKIMSNISPVSHNCCNQLLHSSSSGISSQAGS